MEENSLEKQFQNEIEKAKANSVLNPKIRKQKFVLWIIRTLIAAALFYFFWEKSWIKIALYCYIPLNFFGLVSIFGWNYVLNKKINKTYDLITDLEEQIESMEEE